MNPDNEPAQHTEWKFENETTPNADSDTHCFRSEITDPAEKAVHLEVIGKDEIKRSYKNKLGYNLYIMY
jgi:hypothetical protein